MSWPVLAATDPREREPRDTASSRRHAGGMRQPLGPALVALTLLVACGGAPEVEVEEAEPRDERIFLPDREGPVPVVVLVPGGGWSTADPSGLVPLAEVLSAAGNVAVTTTYRTARTQAYFPVPVADVLCAAASAVAGAADAGREGGPLVLVGHSAGAQLAVLAALRPDALAGECEHPAVVPDAVVGLAGAYDVRALERLSRGLFGSSPEQDPAAWREGDVGTWAAERPELPVLLVHGDLDAVVPPAMSGRLHDQLRAGGHPVDLELLPGVDHLEVYDADVVGPTLVAWVRRLPA